ncbi:hypothetical protein [Vreelandella aquamarina]|uniref:hypothetical protein n=1 Tax=Vreelandella aquamarina TaxID=77097 RepID=UPI0020C5226B|nr:hypothetical protein [Halomonas meridiana]
MILTATLGLPMLGALVLAVSRRWTETTARLFAVGVSLLPVLLLAWAWLQFDTQGALFQFVEEVPWVPSLGMAYRLGVDGIALAIATMSALVFAASIAYPINTQNQPRQYYAWMLFLQSVSLGVFLALDLLLFYVFFDLSLVGMFFLIGRWGTVRPSIQHSSSFFTLSVVRYCCCWHSSGFIYQSSHTPLTCEC